MGELAAPGSVADDWPLAKGVESYIDWRSGFRRLLPAISVALGESTVWREMKAVQALAAGEIAGPELVAAVE